MSDLIVWDELAPGGSSRERGTPARVGHRMAEEVPAGAPPGSCMRTGVLVAWASIPRRSWFLAPGCSDVGRYGSGGQVVGGPR